MSGNLESELFYLRDKVKRLTELNARLSRENDLLTKRWHEEIATKRLVDQKGWGYSE